jgi:hypothetical protein
VLAPVLETHLDIGTQPTAIVEEQEFQELA